MLNMLDNRIILLGIAFVLAVVTSLVTGAFLWPVWLALVFYALYYVSHLPILKNFLPYDLIEENRWMLLVLAGMLWAGAFFWPLSEHMLTTGFIVLTLFLTAILMFEEESKERLSLYLVPLLVWAITVIMHQGSAAVWFVGGALVLVGLAELFRHNRYSEPVQDFNQPAEELSNQTLRQLEKNDHTQTKIKKLTEKIRQLEVDLSSAEMAKMEFLATMSHEIRTPLNGIVPLIDIVLDTELTDFQKDYLTTAHASATQMQKLIDDLLDYSKVEGGKLTVETAALKIAAVIEMVKTNLEQAAAKKGIKIKTMIGPGVSPLLRGDPIRVRQILTNLLSNAIKFSDNGVIKITAAKVKTTANSEVIRFAVQDQGIGIDAEQIEKLFTAFTQADGSTTRKFGGTGLGLAISKKIVELLNGSIGVESDKGKGSTFWFELPFLKSAAGDAPEGLQDDTHQAVLVNTNPDLFKEIQAELKRLDIPAHTTKSLQLAIDGIVSKRAMGESGKPILLFIDFDSNAKSFRQLSSRIEQNELEDVWTFVVSTRSNIAGLNQLTNVRMLPSPSLIENVLNKFSNAGQPSVDEAEQPDDVQLTGAVTPTEEQASAEPVSTESVDGLLPTILLVEDNEVNLKVAEKLIDYIGFPFDVAHNGMEALEKAKENRYRMILMDCQMPVMDGYACTRRVREYEEANQLNRTPIIAMTANAMLGDREKCLAAGMDDYMSKPLNRYILEKTLKKWDPLIQSAPTPQTKEKQAAIVQESSGHFTINNKWLNTQVLSEVEEFMGDETHSLLELFKQESPMLLRKMRKYLLENDFSGVKKIAHTLKSTSANIGANGLSYFCKKMEFAAVNQEKDKIEQLLDKIKKSYLLTIREIEKYKPKESDTLQ